MSFLPRSGRAPQQPASVSNPLGSFIDLLGFALLFGLPFHLGLRLFTENQALLAWKEGAQALGMGIATVYVVLYGGLLWRLVWGTLVLVIIGASIQGGSLKELLPSLEGVFLLGGGVVVGIAGSRWIAGRSQTTKGLGLATPGLLAFVFAAGVLLNDVLNLTYRFTPDLEATTPWWALREGINRARFTMDSPMGAGQFMWLCGIMLSVAAVSVSRTWQRISCGILLIVLAFAVLKTGSRGPYMLFGGSLLLFWSLMAVWGKVRIRHWLLVLPFVVLLGVVFYSVVLSQDSRGAYARILATTNDTSENSNAQRLQRIREGIDVTSDYWPEGLGIQTLSLKSRLQDVNFESHPLGILAALGAYGAVILIAQYALFIWGFFAALRRLSNHDVRVAAYLSGLVTFFVYTMIFPVGQERYAAIIMWLFVGASIGVIELPIRGHFVGVPPAPIPPQRLPGRRDTEPDESAD